MPAPVDTKMLKPVQDWRILAVFTESLNFIMLKKILYGTAFCLAVTCVKAQGVYMPRNIKDAYNNGTRSLTGKPGDQYWQNSGRYDISVTANPPSRTVYGTENIVYHNNSNDVLNNLVIRLICNVHKPQSPRDGYSDKDFLTNGVTIDTLLVNGQGQHFNNDVATVGNVRLPQPLKAHDSVQLHISWHYDVSVQSNREGMIDSTTFFLAYFYPRVSVYDDYNGWDRVPHTGTMEFYNDFNDYTLEVKVPKNYIVWATGTLQNPEAVLQPAVAKQLLYSYTADSVQHIADAAALQQHKVTLQNDWNTWKWTASHIVDMTVGLSDHYVWDAASVIVDSTTRRRASMQAAYKDEAKDFHHSVTFGQHALGWFSSHWPGVAYPFPKMTAFQGFADMEYPMMVNDDSQSDIGFAQFVQDHEIAHTYFPFYMGINETRYSFMDEGWATTLEYLIAIAEKGQDAADKAYKAFRVAQYAQSHATDADMPVITMTNQYNGIAAGTNGYTKPSLSYLALIDMLGETTFKKCLHAYMNNWNGKHPIPWDYFNSFNTAYGESLDWYWNNWFFSNNYIDIAVDKVIPDSKNTVLTVKNTGGFAIPFNVVVTYADGTTATLHQTPIVWKARQAQTTINIPSSQKVSAIQLDNGIFLDSKGDDNSWKAN